MTRPTHLILAFVALFTAAWLLGCKSTSRGHGSEEMIASYEVALITATNHMADAVAELALEVDYTWTSQPSRQKYEFSKKQYDSGKRKVIKIKASKTIPWKDRDKLTFYISTTSPDGYLPSHIWIAAVSSKGSRFTLRDATWENKMFSFEANDPEAVSPVSSASEWVISNYN